MPSDPENSRAAALSPAAATSRAQTQYQAHTTWSNNAKKLVNRLPDNSPSWGELALTIEDMFVEELWVGRNPFDEGSHSNRLVLDLWVLARTQATLTGQLNPPDFPGSGKQSSPELEKAAKAVLLHEVQCIALVSLDEQDPVKRAQDPVKPAQEYRESFYTKLAEVKKDKERNGHVVDADSRVVQRTGDAPLAEDNLTPPIRKKMRRAYKVLGVAEFGVDCDAAEDTPCRLHANQSVQEQCRKFKARAAKLNQAVQKMVLDLEQYRKVASWRLFSLDFSAGSMRWCTKMPKGVQLAFKASKSGSPREVAEELCAIFKRRLRVNSGRDENLKRFYGDSVTKLELLLTPPVPQLQRQGPP